MNLPVIIILLISHISFGISQFAYSKQTLKTPKHALNWICTVDINVAPFTKHNSSDITERFLTSNYKNIIPTLSRQ
jgi:hypothetical protein